MIIEIILVSVTLWIMMMLWVFITKIHERKMDDVKDCRMKASCMGCTGACDSKNEQISNQHIEHQM